MKKQRYRIRFSKTPHMKFTGHLDLILTWERTFRRANLPLSYSEGFSPRPVMNLAAPLPLGYTSTAEIGDFWLSEIIATDQLRRGLTRAVPPGIELDEIDEIDDIHGPKLPSLVQQASYQVVLPGKPTEIKEKIDALLKSNSFQRTRKGKTYDLRPLINSLGLKKSDSTDFLLDMTLSMLPGATGRPDEVLAALELSLEGTKICRTGILLKET
jgi:radical SAM-linked protein